MIDLRSDTVTQPTAAMRAAMADAVVGDDAYGEDPSVKALESRAAELLGKDAALFVPSGTMGNIIAVKLHTHCGEEILCAERSHLMDFESSMVAWFAGCLIRQVVTPDGIMSWSQLDAHIDPHRPVFAPVTLVVIEHPHNMGGGTLYSLESIDEICDQSHRRGLSVHMDGSRLFNAVAATGIAASRITQNVDTVMFCLSKGLGAPVGSILAGSSGTMTRARLFRRALGGAMRQSGVIAAPALIALDTMRGRLAEDHRNAKRLATGLAQMVGIAIDADAVNTNIVIGDVAGTGLSAERFIASLAERGVLVSRAGGTRIRMVTHLGVTYQDCDVALDAVRDVASSVGARTASMQAV